MGKLQKPWLCAVSLFCTTLQLAACTSKLTWLSLEDSIQYPIGKAPSMWGTTQLGAARQLLFSVRTRIRPKRGSNGPERERSLAPEETRLPIFVIGLRYPYNAVLHVAA
jgi:hypothetical protein